MSNKCREYCKWLGYEYTKDNDDNIKSSSGYFCELYKEPLDDKPNKCTQCLADAINKNYKKGK